MTFTRPWSWLCWLEPFPHRKGMLLELGEQSGIRLILLCCPMLRNLYSQIYHCALLGLALFKLEVKISSVRTGCMFLVWGFIFSFRGKTL